jgi:hypothetical protein
VPVTRSPFARIGAMLLVPMFVVILISCDSGGSGSSSAEPYANSPEGKPKYSPPPVPDPPEVLETLPAGQLPSFLAKASPRQKETLTAAYKGAVENYDQYKYIPCYCGCSIYTTKHTGLNDCYIKERKADGNIVFTDHSMTCDKCLEGATMTLEGVAAGRPLKEVRADIFKALGYTGLWTDTPPVP